MTKLVAAYRNTAKTTKREDGVALVAPRSHKLRGNQSTGSELRGGTHTTWR
jgi:hypothetical protein